MDSKDIPWLLRCDILSDDDLSCDDDRRVSLNRLMQTDVSCGPSLLL